MQTYTLSAKKLSKFQKYESTKSFKITLILLKRLHCNKTFYGVFLWYHRL